MYRGGPYASVARYLWRYETTRKGPWARSGGPRQRARARPRTCTRPSGGRRSNSGLQGPTYDQLYEEAKRLNLQGRSSMDKAELKCKPGH